MIDSPPPLLADWWIAAVGLGFDVRLSCRRAGVALGVTGTVEVDPFQIESHHSKF